MHVCAHMGTAASSHTLVLEEGPQVVNLTQTHGSWGGGVPWSCGPRGVCSVVREGSWNTEVRVRGTLVHLGKQPHRVQSCLCWAHGQLGVDAGPGFLLLSQGQAREEPPACPARGSGLLPYEPADGLVSYSLLPVSGLL